MLVKRIMEAERLGQALKLPIGLVGQVLLAKHRPSACPRIPRRTSPRSPRSRPAASPHRDFIASSFINSSRQESRGNTSSSYSRRNES